MSNSNSIFAIAADTQTSAVSYDGSTWTGHQLPPTMTWRFIGGSIGKFIYYPKNTLTPYSRILYSITDNVNFVAGVLPTTQTPVLIAIADGDPGLYKSTDGINFGTIAAPNFTYTVIGQASSTSTAVFVRVNTLVKSVTARAGSLGTAMASTAATYNRTMMAVARGLGSIFNKGNNV